MPEKASDDYKKLRKLLRENHTIESISIDIGSEGEKTAINLKKTDGSIIVFESRESDVAMFGFSVKQSYDKKGISLIGEVKSIEQYYNNIEQLYDPENKKFNEEVKQLLEGKKAMEYVPHDLLKQFLEDPSTTKYKPYLKLIEDYYVIKYSHLLHIQELHQGITSIKRQKSQKTKIFETVLDLFRLAFRQEGNFVKVYQEFQKYNTSDPLDLLRITSGELDHDKDKFEMLSKRGGIPAEHGIKYIIESYATLAESVIKMLNLIRAAIEITKGVDNPKVLEDAVTNWKKIENDAKYGFIVDNFDPRIRHGKAHNNYEVDVKNSRIDFFEKGRIKKVSFSYTFGELRIMWQQVNILVSALIMAVCVELGVITALMLDSKEYKLLLANLGNFKKI